jgi:hypothetical protein
VEVPELNYSFEIETDPAGDDDGEIDFGDGDGEAVLETGNVLAYK